MPSLIQPIRFLVLFIALFAAHPSSSLASDAPPKPQAVVSHYADLAHAIYSDALTSADVLRSTIDRLLASPSEAHLQAARAAWREARVPYQQSEVFRFGNPVVDDWEGKMNSWPLDEGLIDYVAPGYIHALGNIGAQLNIIANPSLQLGGTTIDASAITPALLRDLHELAGSEANVATGYHAIEFLLWGQDLNGHQPGAGERPWTDFAQGDNCTHGHCQRRGDYLRATTELLLEDLKYMVAQWSPDHKDNYRATLLALPTDKALARILFGMGSLSLGELGGERIKVALEANSTEDEHDCFSDNTHWSHYYNGLGIQNVYLGHYTTLDGKTLSGPAIGDLVAAQNKEVDVATRRALQDTVQSLTTLTELAEREIDPMPFDRLIAEGSDSGAQLLSQILDNLVVQTRQLESAAAAIDINPNATL